MAFFPTLIFAMMSTVAANEIHYHGNNVHHHHYTAPTTPPDVETSQTVSSLFTARSAGTSDAIPQGCPFSKNFGSRAGPPKPPKFDCPLITEPDTNIDVNYDTLGPLKHLLGTWTNQAIGTNQLNTLDSKGPGYKYHPFSYNTMPLPQFAKLKYGENATSPALGSEPDTTEYIQKNFAYYEVITFNAIGNAPNRGGLGTQQPNGIVYEQRVYFAEGPGKDSLVHFENGIWLWLTKSKQLSGPYVVPTGDPGNNVVPSSNDANNVNADGKIYNVNKQISIPHANSVNAPGNVFGGNPEVAITATDLTDYGTKCTGGASQGACIGKFTPSNPLPRPVGANPAEVLAFYDSVLAAHKLGDRIKDNLTITGVTIEPLVTLSNNLSTYPPEFANPSVHLTLNPNEALNEGMTEAFTKGLKLEKYIHLQVDSKFGDEVSPVTNNYFGQKHVAVNQYITDLYLEELSCKGPDCKTAKELNAQIPYTQLQYNQWINLDFQLKNKKVLFPHITTNTLTRRMDLPPFCIVGCQKK